MNYCDRLREIRLNNGETQQQIADVLGISQQSYMRYERGINEMPIRRVVLLCKHYNVSADYLLGLTDDLKLLYPAK